MNNFTALNREFSTDASPKVGSIPKAGANKVRARPGARLTQWGRLLSTRSVTSETRSGRSRPASAARARSAPSTPPVESSFSVDHLNAWRLHRQWLDRPFTGRNLVDLVRSTGWLYSPGCSTPYLSLWARARRFRPATLDRLVFRDRKLIQIETLRGCTMLVPRDQAAVALRVRSRIFTELAKQARSILPISEKELERLKRAVTEVLESGPATYADIMDAVPADLVRPFPPGLKRVGLDGSLWLAISLLKEEGRIVKMQSGRRLDSTSYTFALLTSVLPDVDLVEMKNERATSELAAHYFSIEGPARIRDFAWWAGIHVSEAIRATENIEPSLVPVGIEGTSEEFLIGETEADAFRSFRVPDQASVNLLPYRDTYLKGQREIVNRFVRDEHFDKPFSRWKGKLINDPLATVVHAGRVVGIWEWSGGPGRNGTSGIEYLLFDDADSELVSRVDRRAEELGAFIGDGLGDCRLQGLDYGKNQMTRIHDLQKHWGQGAQAKVG